MGLNGCLAGGNGNAQQKSPQQTIRLNRGLGGREGD